MTRSREDVLDGLLRGAVDLHVHPFPSPFPRRIDILQSARHAAEHGFRAIVVKSHHHSTATDVAALKPHGLDATGVKVFGAVALNNQVGGLNPWAANMTLALGGKVVWFPTIASPAHIEHDKHGGLKFPSLAIPLMPERPITVFGDDRALKPEVRDILRLVAEADGILASGHMPPDWIIAVFAEAREVGVRRMVLNHPNFVIEATMEQAAKIADLGAVVEHSVCMYDEDSTFFQGWSIESLVEWVRTIGPERSSIGSDLGQENNPLPADAFRKICGRLLDAGLGEAEVRGLVADNPARLLGLDD
ncbi:MAG: DUF6282 family protein [Actinomycetota bacterium]